MDRFNGILYGLGPSQNDDIYIEEYKALALEYSNGHGKLTNLNTIAGHHLPTHMGDNNSSGSTASTSSTGSQVMTGINNATH